MAPGDSHVIAEPAALGASTEDIPEASAYSSLDMRRTLTCVAGSGEQGV